MGRCEAVAVAELPCHSEHGERVFCDFATKLLLNAVSTGANVVRTTGSDSILTDIYQEKGAVFGNSMINLTVSNNKVTISVCGC